MIIACIADTHGMQNRIAPPPPVDVVIHAGDHTANGTMRQWEKAMAWLGSIEAIYRYAVAGNHDICTEAACPSGQTRWARSTAYRYGVDLFESAEQLIAELRGGPWFAGSPLTPVFQEWAHMYDPLKENPWEELRPCVDVLITHGPPWGFRDRERGEALGDKALLLAIERVRPALHVCGHIHGGRGEERYEDTLVVNCSAVDVYYNLRPKPWTLVELSDGRAEVAGYA